MPSLEDYENSTSLKFNLLGGAFSRDQKPEEWNIADYRVKISRLTEYDLSDCAFQAALNGNVRLLRLLNEERGPIQVAYENSTQNPDKHTLNGVTCNMDGIKRLKDLQSVADFKDLLKAIQEFGVEGLTEPGDTYPALFYRIDSNKFVDGLSIERFAGALPKLSGGVLTNPELAIALRHEEASNPHPMAYKPILCWAKPEMVDSFPDSLAPLTPFQSVGGIYGKQPLHEFKAGDGIRFDKITTGVKASSNARYSDLMMKSLCPLSAYYGFDEQNGLVLCETTTEFLLGFELAGITPENTQAAKDFAKGYCPIEILATMAVDTCVDDYGHPNNLWFTKSACSVDHRDSFSEIFALAADDHPLKDMARSMLQPDQWKDLLKKAGTKLDAESLIAMHQAFGFDNTGLKITVRSNEISQYLAANFRFSDESEFFNTTKRFKYYLDENIDAEITAVLSTFDFSSLKDLDVSPLGEETVLERATNSFRDVVVKLNLWPSDSERPVDLADALRMSGPMDLNSWGCNRALGLRAILVDAGLPACAEVANTSRSWLKLTEAFSREEITPYMNQMSKESRGSILEQDLGI